MPSSVHIEPNWPLGGLVRITSQHRFATGHGNIEFSEHAYVGLYLGHCCDDDGVHIILWCPTRFERLDVDHITHTEFLSGIDG